ncbi:hypothetical protein SESBI_01604 [Sesbania bispinosa]|nr:hypothetical protein SESBI_01604 [Sesbania bispinosa]
MWQKTDQGVMYPPTYKKGPGRPKKLRRREPNEDPTLTKLKRMNTKYACSFCHSYGHNSRKCNLKPREEPPPPAGEQSVTVDGNSAPQIQEPQTQATASGPVQLAATSQDVNIVAANPQIESKFDKVEGSQLKRQRKTANPRQLIPNSIQKERLQKKCINKGPSQIQKTQTPTEIQLNLLDALNEKLKSSMTDLNRVSESPLANYIQSTKDVQKVMGLARQVISGEQSDWNVVTKEMPISPDLLHTYNTVQQLSNFARTLTGGEGGKSHEDGGTKPTDPFIPPRVMVPQME